MKNWAVAGSLLALVAPAFASGQSLRLTDTTILEYRGDNQNGSDKDDDYGMGLTKLYLNGEMDRTSVHAQVDAVLFSRYPDVANPTVANPSLHRDEARLERISLVHSLGEFGDGTLTVGDSYLQLGRGLALSLRKVDELGTDQALQGGSLAYTGEQFGGMVFAGRTNIANLDTVTNQWLEDPSDTLAGGSGTMYVGRAVFSVHGLVLQPRKEISGSDDNQTLLGGAYLELPATDWLSLYVEGAYENYQLVGKDFQGTAGYASADVDLQFASLLLEGLYLKDFQVMGSKDDVLGRRNVYNQPPTLERFDQEVLDNENVRGGRAKVSRSFLDGSLVVYLNGMYRQYGPESSLIDALHGYAGFELTYGAGSRWYASGGYRNELHANGDPLKDMIHGETDWVQELGGGYAFHLTVNHESRTAHSAISGALAPGGVSVAPGDYVRGSTLIGLDRSGWGSITTEVGYDTQNPNAQQEFLAAIVTWDAADWANLRTVIGSQRGGIKCIGGVCRDFPAFNGVRFEGTVYYDAM